MVGSGPVLVQGHLSEEGPSLSSGKLAEAGSQGPAASSAGSSSSLCGCCQALKWPWAPVLQF